MGLLSLTGTFFLCAISEDKRKLSPHGVYAESYISEWKEFTAVCVDTIILFLQTGKTSPLAVNKANQSLAHRTTFLVSWTRST